jgi:hypothetical protein
MADINIVVIDETNVVVKVTESDVAMAITDEVINVATSDIPLPLNLYQKRIWVGENPPNNPQINDLWIQIN